MELRLIFIFLLTLPTERAIWAEAKAFNPEELTQALIMLPVRKVSFLAFNASQRIKRDENRH